MDEERRRLRPEEAARYIGVSVSTLAKFRMSGEGPAYIKVGQRVVLYDTAEIEDWLASRRRTSTGS